MGRFVELALRQAARSRCRQRVGAVLVKGNRVLAQSPNRFRNAPWVAPSHVTFHAEESLLRRVGDAAGAAVYVARLSGAGLPALAKPCARCQVALSGGGVLVAYYTTPEGVGALRLGRGAADVHGGSGLGRVCSERSRCEC
ncbi:hypothetical protein ABT160_46460 [Streptomyces sp. NPDC001941]|uniref:hypothetical protein n=1 Tax=Streptomyces sp. NPDC001941 TaxID=3154659 RepID=UPI003325B8CC